MKIKSILFAIVFFLGLCGTIQAQDVDQTTERRLPQYSCVDIHKYEHTMWLTCQLFEGDQRIDDFEIAVFDQNGECRGQSLSGEDKNFPSIAYVTIHGVSGVDSCMTVRVVYGDEEDRYKYNKEVEGLTFKMVSDESFGVTRHPFPIVMAGKAAFSWATGEGEMQQGTVAQLSPELLQGATRLSLRGSWSADDQQQLQEVLPRATLEELHLSSEWGKVDFSELLNGCSALTALHLHAQPEAVTADVMDVVNPNCLVYLPEGTTVPMDGWKNVVAEGAEAYTALTDLRLEGSTTDRLCPFALDKDLLLNGHHAIYIPKNLNFVNGKGGWNTIVLPFDADIYADETCLAGNFDEYVHPDSYWLMRYRRLQEASLVLTYVETGLSAHIPYLLALPGAALGEDVALEHRKISFRSRSEVVKAIPAKIEDPFFASHPQDFEFLGNYRLLDTGAPVYLLGALSSGSSAFISTAAGGVLPFTGYLQCREGVAPAPSEILVSDHYLPTGIEDLLLDHAAEQKIFDLSGRRVENPGQLRSGVYIVNGRKTILIRN